MSEVWNYFEIDIDNRYAICGICGARISRGGVSKTTSPLKKHLKQHNFLELQEAIKKRHLNAADATTTSTEDLVDSPMLSPLPFTSTTSLQNLQPIENPTVSEKSSENLHQLNLTISSPVDIPILSPAESFESEQSSSSSKSPWTYKIPSTKKFKHSVNQPTIQQVISKTQSFKAGDKRREKITHLIAEMICTDMQPVSVVEDIGFRKLIQYLEPRYPMVTRKYLANNVLPELYEKQCTAIRSELRKVEHICFTIDFWTSLSNQDYMSLTAHFIDDNFNLQEFCLEVTPFSEISHTAANILEFLKDTLAKWDVADKVQAIVHDSAANMVAAMNTSDFGHIPCLAHLLQRVLDSALFKEATTSKIVGTCRRVVSHFKHSAKATKVLKDAQATVKTKQHRLIQDEPTRWDSTYEMLARLKEQKHAIALASSTLEMTTELRTTDWTYIDNLEDILKVFYEATKILSKTETSASEIIPIIHSTQEFLKLQTNLSTGMLALKYELLSQMKHRFQNWELEALYTLPMMLDPRFKGRMFSNERNFDIAKNILINEIKKKTDLLQQLTNNQKQVFHQLYLLKIKFSQCIQKYSTENQLDLIKELLQQKKK